MVSQYFPGRRARNLLDLKIHRFQESARSQWQTHLYSPVQLHQLTLATGIDDRGLLRRMLEHGLRADCVLALKYAPVAEVAWASGQVTKPEYVMAVRPVFSAELFQSQPATEMFRSWLRVRPAAGLWQLWEDYVKEATAHSRQPADRQFGQRLYDLAAEVALASGGLLDEGGICRAEQRVLDRIRVAYNLGGDNGKVAPGRRCRSVWADDQPA